MNDRMQSSVPRKPRAEPRLATSVASFYRTAITSADCEILDLSAGGALIVGPSPLAEGERLLLAVPAAGALAAQVVAATDRGIHLTFLDATPDQGEAIRRFVFGRLAAE